MGFRLHYAEEYKVRYGGGFCNHHQEEFNALLYDLCNGEVWGNEQDFEYADEIEIHRDVLRDAIKKLKEYKDDDLPDGLVKGGMTVATIDAILYKFLVAGDPDTEFVHLKWF